MIELRDGIERGDRVKGLAWVNARDIHRAGATQVPCGVPALVPYPPFVAPCNGRKLQGLSWVKFRVFYLRSSCSCVFYQNIQSM